jgi:hypothetical protein
MSYPSDVNHVREVMNRTRLRVLRVGLPPGAFWCHGGLANRSGGVACHRLVSLTYRLCRAQQVWLDGVLLVGKKVIVGFGNCQKARQRGWRIRKGTGGGREQNADREHRRSRNKPQSHSAPNNKSCKITMENDGNVYCCVERQQIFLRRGRW